MFDFAETIRRSTQRAAREKLLAPEMVQTGRAIRPGGAGGLLTPTGIAVISYGTAEVLVKAIHCGKWIWCDNIDASPLGIGADKDLKMPPDPVVGDPYFFTCYNNAPNFVHLRPNTGQTILMPSGVVPIGKYVDLGNNGTYSGMALLILVCSAANTWMCVDATTSVIGVG